MENQKTIMDKQNKEIDAILNDDGKTELDNMYTAFIEQHDFSEAPTLQARQAGAWTRKNILLDTWNQWLNYETRMAEHFGDYPKDKGFRHLNNTRRCDMALNFAHYFLGAMEAQVKFIDEEAKKSKEV